jgi:PPM family protein phosphatase
MNEAPPEFVTSFHWIARSDVGMRRANNQDSVKIVSAEDEASWQQRGHLLIVADGMGAHAAGELASKLAVENIPHLYYHDRELAPHDALRAAITQANGEIYRRGMANQDFQGMGTTASVLALLPQGAFVGHVGDSRVYRLRDGCLEQLTFDHSLQWEVRRNHRISEDSDFARMIPKNVITRSLGPNSQVTVDIEGPFPLQKGDQFLVCSDGLTGQIPDEELAELMHELSPEEGAQVLVDLANLRGGPDNITLILVRVLDDRVLSEPQGASPGRRPPKSAGSFWGATVAAPISGVCLLFAILLLFAGQAVAAGVLTAAGISVLIGAAIGWFRRRMTAPSHEVDAEERVGRAPYATCRCDHDGMMAETLSKTLDELRQAARDENWSVSWQDIDALRDSAGKLAESGQYPQAIRHYAQAIRQMMAQLRKQPR